MTEKHTNLFGIRVNVVSAFWGVFVSVFVLVFGLNAAIIFTLPKIYASTARIKVENDSLTGDGRLSASTPDSISTYLQIIQSQSVLSNVVEKLNLNAEWGRKYYDGQVPKAAEIVQLLNRRTKLAPVYNTTLIEITEYSDDRIEAAQIANAIAEATTNIVRRNWVEDQKVHLIPKTPLAYVTDTATPSLRPVKPNKSRGIAMGAILGIVLASAAGGVSTIIFLLISKRSHRKSRHR